MAQVGGALTIIGTGFGQEVEAVRVMVGGRECRDPELCHLVCRPCGEGGRCNVDEICIVDGLNNQKVCGCRRAMCSKKSLGGVGSNQSPGCAFLDLHGRDWIG